MKKQEFKKMKRGLGIHLGMATYFAALWHIIITLPKINDKEKTFKAAREKEIVTYKGVPITLSADFSKETLASKKGLEREI